MRTGHVDSANPEPGNKFGSGHRYRKLRCQISLFPGHSPVDHLHSINIDKKIGYIDNLS